MPSSGKYAPHRNEYKIEIKRNEIEFQETASSMPEASGSGVADEADYSTFENKSGLADDMKFLASMPELCDVTFLVGDTREPVCAVKAVLAARSRLFSSIYTYRT